MHFYRDYCKMLWEIFEMLRGEMLRRKILNLWGEMLWMIFFNLGGYEDFCLTLGGKLLRRLLFNLRGQNVTKPIVKP